MDKDEALINSERRKLDRAREVRDGLEKTINKSIADLLRQDSGFKQQIRNELLNSRGNRGGSNHSFKGTGDGATGYGVVPGDEVVTGYEDRPWERD